MSNHLGKLSLGKSQDPLPLYSLGFVAIRTSLVSLVCLLLGLTYITLSCTETIVDNQLKAITQNVQLEFSALEKSQIYESPETVIKKIESKLEKAQG